MAGCGLFDSTNDQKLWQLMGAQLDKYSAQLKSWDTAKDNLAIGCTQTPWLAGPHSRVGAHTHKRELKWKGSRLQLSKIFILS